VPAGRLVRGAEQHAELIALSDAFPDEVAAVLAGGGWLSLAGVSRDALADTAIKDTVRTAVRAALGDFPVLQVLRRGAGARRLIRPLTIDPMAAAHSADVLGEFAEVIGAPVFPLGVEARGDGWLVVDERGRVFALDQGGEWFVGGSVDEALTGDGPAERIRDDGSWLGRGDARNGHHRGPAANRTVRRGNPCGVSGACGRDSRHRAAGSGRDIQAAAGRSPAGRSPVARNPAAPERRRARAVAAVHTPAGAAGPRPPGALGDRSSWSRPRRVSPAHRGRERFRGIRCTDPP
jgi:hypothetical protein